MKYQKTFSKIKGFFFFFLRIEKMMGHFKNEGFFFVQEAEKQKIGDPKKLKKRKEIKNTCTQKEGKMEQEKTCVFLKKKRETTN